MSRPAFDLNVFKTHGLFGFGLAKLTTLAKLQVIASESKWNDVFTSGFFQNQYQALNDIMWKGNLYDKDPELPAQQMMTMRGLLSNLHGALNTARERYRSAAGNKVSAGYTDDNTNWVEQGACSEDLIMTIIKQLDTMVPERR